MQRQGHQHDPPVPRRRPQGGHPGERGGHPVHRQTQLHLCGRPHGPLARGSGELRLHRQDSLFRRRLRLLRGAERHPLCRRDRLGAGLAGRSPAVLHQHCGQIRPPGDGPAGESLQAGHPDDLPSPRPCVAQKFWANHRPVRQVGLL